MDSSTQSATRCTKSGSAPLVRTVTPMPSDGDTAIRVETPASPPSWLASQRPRNHDADFLGASALVAGRAPHAGGDAAHFHAALVQALEALPGFAPLTLPVVGHPLAV